MILTPQALIRDGQRSRPYAEICTQCGGTGGRRSRRLQNNNLGLNGHPHHLDEVALVVSTGGIVDEEVSRFLVLGTEIVVVAGSLDSHKGVVHDLLHLLLELGNNVDGNELLGIARDLCGVAAPLVNISVHVHSEVGSVGCFHQLAEFIGHGNDGSSWIL